MPHPAVPVDLEFFEDVPASLRRRFGCRKATPAEVADLAAMLPRVTAAWEDLERVPDFDMEG